MPKYAVILKTTINANEFRSSFGFYHKHIHDLEKAGYEILKIDLIDVVSLKKQLQKLPKSSVGFFWLRVHGSPQSMTASENFKIDLTNINEIFNELPFILSEQAIIFLDSCSTGSFKDGCNNMQFAFAKLTLDKLNIQIVAPSDYLHVPYFSISEDGNFTFEMMASPRSTKNISVILGPQTKTILNKAIASNILLENVENELKNSLQVNKSCPFLESFISKFGSDFNLTDQLINVIKGFEKYDITSKEVKELIEIYHANPNYPEGVIIAVSGWRNSTPLASAIYYKHGEMVLYLLEHGADPYYKIEGKNLIDYAKQHDDDNGKGNFELKIINSRRKKENDDSKMFETIKGFLDLKNDRLNENSEIPLNLKESYQPIFTLLPEVIISENVDDKKQHLNINPNTTYQVNCCPLL